MVVQIGQRLFATKKLAEIYVRNLIATIGICASVRAFPQFDEIMTVLRLHSQADQKLANMVDLRIRQNTINRRALAIDVIKEDGSVVDISWLHCISPRSFAYYWNSALRHSIWPQIHAFKLSNPTDICPLCKEKINVMHVDHYQPQFAQLVHDFSQIEQLPVDAETSETLNGDTCLAIKHKEYEEKWQAYHRQQANLRVICEHCNLTRPRR